MQNGKLVQLVCVSTNETLIFFVLLACGSLLSVRQGVDMLSTRAVCGGRLDKKSLDIVQHQLLENGLDLGEIQECSLMDNERGGTFFLKFSTTEAVLRVWDRHCSWWAFEFAAQSEREVWALRLAEAAGVPVPSVMATGTMEQVSKLNPVWFLGL